MSSFREIREDDVSAATEAPGRLVRALNASLQAAAAGSGAHRKQAKVRVLLSVATFSEVIPNPGFAVGGVVVVKVQNLDGSDTALSAAPWLNWAKTPSGDVALTSYVPTPSADTVWTVELIEDEVSNG